MEEKILKLIRDEFNLTQQQVDHFSRYAILLKEWNKKLNLTAIKDDEEIAIKHFYDSLLCTNLWNDWEDMNLIDIGTGAGFPGIPLKIYNKDLNVVLFDSLKKKLHFLDFLIQDLELDNISTLHGRAEDLGKDPQHREMYDIVTARAVAKLSVLLELSLPFVKVGGIFIAFKGPEGHLELEDSKNSLEILGGEFLEAKSFTIEEKNYNRVIMVFKKTKNTPSKYPRKAGIPQKRSLQNRECK